MRSLRPLLVIGCMLVLSAGALGAQGAQVTCKDGSKSAGGQGACSGHGGISAKATSKAEARAAKSAMKADAKVAAADAKTAKTEMKADAKAAKAKTEAKAEKAEAKADAKAAKAEAKMDAKMSMDDKDAKGAIAMCTDMTYSHAKTHQGACSQHGGVSKFLDGK
jgi:hypothetical protein